MRPVIEQHLADAAPRADAVADVASDAVADAWVDAVVDAPDAFSSCAVNNGGCGDARTFECVDGAPVRCALRCDADRAQILGEVRRIDTRNVLFSPLVVHGDGACPMMVTASGRAFAAFAREGAGRVVWFGQDSMLTTLATQADTGALLRNALAWGVRGGALRGARVGLEPAPSLGAVATIVAREGGTAEDVSALALRADRFDAWVTASTQAPTTEAELANVRDFVRAGGLLLHAGQAWNWARTRPSEPASRYPGNALVPSAGIFVVPSAIAAADTAAGATVTPTEFSHARRALAHTRAERALTASEQTLVAASLVDPIEHLPFDTEWWSAARALPSTAPLPTPTRDRPVRPATQPLDAIRLRALGRINRDGPDAWVSRAALSEDFPGAASGATARVTVTVDVAAPAADPRFLFAQTSAKVWRSTGVYAPAGQRVIVSVPESATGLGLEAQIGMHDRSLLAEPQWDRAPSLVRARSLTVARTEMVSAFGGLVYVLVPAASASGAIDVTIEGGIAAPSFVRGRSAPAPWRAAVSASAVPWGELVGARVILTLPLAALRAVTDPEALIDHWDAVLTAMADLAGQDPATLRPERVVFDRQLLGGVVADSGYPGVRLVDRVAIATDLPTLQRDGDWGTTFLFGRRFQSRDWLVPGADDATVSLFQLYALEQVSGRTLADSPNPSLAPASRSARIDVYVSGGRNYGRDFNGLVALEMYLQLVEGFGWATLRRIVHEYQALPELERPATDDARVQQWVVRSSRVCNRDLSPFYSRWGLPVSASTRTVTAMYPPWTEAPARP